MPFIEVVSNEEKTLVNTQQIVEVKAYGDRCQIKTTALTRDGYAYTVYADESYGTIYNMIRRAAGAPVCAGDVT